MAHNHRLASDEVPSEPLSMTASLRTLCCTELDRGDSADYVVALQNILYCSNQPTLRHAIFCDKNFLFFAEKFILPPDTAITHRWVFIIVGKFSEKMARQNVSLPDPHYSY